MDDRHLYEQTPALLWAIAPDGTLARVSDRWLAQFGYDRAAVIDRPVLDLIAAGDRAAVTQALGACWQGPVTSFACRILAADGSLPSVQFSITGVEDSQGQPSYGAVAMAALPIKPDTAQSACPDLTASPQLLRTIFDALPQRIFWKDTQGRFLGCNRQFAEDFGFASSQDICGKTNEDLGLPDDLVTQYQLADAEVLTTGRPQWQQEHYKTYRDGRQGWVRATKVPLSGTEGGPIAVLDTYEDISAQKQTEQALQRYRHMVEATTDAICLLDRNYRYQVINRTYADWYGYDGSPILGRTVAEVLGTEAFEQRLKPRLERCLAGETMRYAQWFEYPHLGRRFRSVTCTPYREGDGQVSGVLTSIRDLTDLKRAAAQQQQLLEIIESTSDFIGTATVAGQTVYLNPAWKQFLGHSADHDLADLGITRIQDCHPPEAAKIIVEEGIPTAISQGTWQGETALLATDGAVVPIAQTITAHRNNKGKVTFLSTIARDVRHLKRLEHSLQTILQGTATAIGDDFFMALAQYLSEALGVAYVMINEWVKPATLRQLAFWHHGHAQACGTYAIANTPCRRTLRERYYVCPQEVVAAFPNDQDLVDMGAESYMGVALTSRGGEVLGEICILHTAPLTALDHARQVVEIFAARAAAELERQQADRALRQSETLNRAIIQALPDLLMRLRRDGICLDVQYPDGFPALQNRQQQIGRPLAEIMGPDLAAQRIQYAEQALDSGQPQVYEFQITVGQVLRWEEARVVPLGKDEVLVLVRNIHDRKQAEQEIQRLNQVLVAQNQRLETLVEERTAELTTFMNALPDQIFVVDRATGQMLFGNDAVAVAAGCDRQHYQGRRVQELFEPDRAAYYEAQNRQVFTTGEILHVEESMATPQGEIEVDTYKIPLKRPNGEVYALIGTSRDITDRVRAREALATQTAQLAATNRELASFAYSVSHDLRAPLRHMDGFIAVLQQHLAPILATDTDAAHYLARIQHSSRKMGQLIAALLDLSQVGRQPLHRAVIALDRTVQSALSLLSLGSTETCVLTVQPLPRVEGDGTLIQQVFVNLLENAVKFSRDRTPAQITVGCRRDGVLYVQDNGVGFDMTYADKLFSPFQRLHPAKTFPGTGIGLAIVQRIIHRHQGQIWVESTPNAGTTVFFTFGTPCPPQDVSPSVPLSPDG
jgi:PAS domain S-box-containing protein